MSVERRGPYPRGKAKILYSTDRNDFIVQHFKDDATGFNGLKKGQILGKGPINNSISAWVFQYLEKHGIPTHFVEKTAEREMLIKRVKIIPVEVVVRNLAAGSICKRLGIEKKHRFEPPFVEFFLKSDELGDPLISERHIFYFKWATPEQLKEMESKALRVNKLLTQVFDQVGLTLVDFKLEFGTDNDGNILLADEFTGDGCRLWDKETGEPLDKDRFRHDLGRVEESYQEVYQRLKRHFEGN